jgi:protein-S-isoprenylcysteine O-methyltransferase Ste14
LFDALYTPSTAGWLLLTLLFYGWGAFELAANLRLWQPGSPNRDRLSRYVIIVGMLAGIVLAVAATHWHAFDITITRAVVFYTGLALMVAGLAFRAYAMRQLGRLFIPEVRVQPGQKLVQAGPYRLLRHPSYTGMLITVLGYGLALTNWLSLAVLLAVAGLVFGWRMRVEEAALLEAFGDEYRAYMQRTKRLIPWLY